VVYLFLEVALENSVLDGLDLHRAMLENLNMACASLRKANLRGALMQNAILVKADLTGSKRRVGRATTKPTI